MKDVYHLEDNVHVVIREYPNFTHYAVAFGEARYMGNMVIASEGVAEAHLWYGNPTPPEAGSLIPGHDLPDPKFRIGAVGPHGRTVVQEVGDKFIQTDDIIDYLIGLRPIIRRAPQTYFPASNWEDLPLVL